MSTQAITETCYLAYGVGRKTPDNHLNTSLARVTSANISLFYQAVPLSEFGEESLTQNLNDIDWLESKVIEFEKQMEVLIHKTTIVPFRFGTVYTSMESIKKFLYAYHNSFLENLNSIAGKSEWGVKVFLSRTIFRKWLVLEADIRSSQAKTTSPGANFFNRKKIEYKIQEQENEKLNKILAKIFCEIKTMTDGCKEIDFLDGFKENGSSLIPVFSLALLISDTKSKRLHSLVNGVTKRYKQAGLVLRLSGPWPVYNFLQIEDKP